MEAASPRLKTSTQDAQKAAAEKAGPGAGKASDRLPEARRGEGDARSTVLNYDFGYPFQQSY